MPADGEGGLSADGGVSPEHQSGRTRDHLSASTDAVDEELKTRAMDEAPVGITIADATDPEMPLIYANAAFERITGYPPSYAVGRNCRFLQGEATRAGPVDQMRTAISAGESTTVELRNYRRDGELFWNEITIAPLRDGSGEVAQYVGFQQDVTRRKRAERAAAERATRLKRERAAQRRLLNRLDGVIANATAAVTGATDRADLECDVVDRIDRTYAGAWIGRYDPAAGDLTIQTAAGTTEHDSDDDTLAVATDSDSPTESTVAGAITDQYVHTEQLDAESEPTTFAAIPLYYGDATYGAIGVYTSEEGGFGHTERPVLTALGRTVATGINAIESRRTRHDDERIEIRVEVNDHPLTKFATRADCEVTSLGQVNDREGSSLLFEASTDERDVAPEALREAATDLVTVHSIFAEDSGTPVVELSIADRRLPDALADHGGEFNTMTADETGTTVTVEFTRETLAQSFVAVVTDGFEHATLAGYSRCTRRQQTRPELVAALRESLTERQYATLVRAHTLGYFEWPHETSGEEIAAAMGVNRSTFHQHLRAAQKKLAAAFLDADPTKPN